MIEKPIFDLYFGLIYDIETKKWFYSGMAIIYPG